MPRGLAGDRGGNAARGSPSFEQPPRLPSAPPTSSKNTMTRPHSLIPYTLLATLSLGTAVAQPHHHNFPQDIDAFHAVLAPIWHARPGKARSRDACAKAGQMAALAAHIQSADAAALKTSIAALQTTCKGKPADIDGALHDVHEAFHSLIEAH